MKLKLTLREVGDAYNALAWLAGKFQRPWDVAIPLARLINALEKDALLYNDKYSEILIKHGLVGENGAETSAEELIAANKEAGELNGTVIEIEYPGDLPIKYPIAEGEMVDAMVVMRLLKVVEFLGY